jgi:hypothetical protein
VPNGLFLDIPSAYDCPTLTDVAVSNAVVALGYRLPDEYIGLLRRRNGGLLRLNRFRTRDRLNEGVLFTLPLIFGIGGDAGLDAPIEEIPLSKYLIQQWNYPDVGVVFSQFGHAAYLFDYSGCGPEGEPRVIYVDAEQPDDVQEFSVASNFSELLAGLSEEETNETQSV